jgi:hypothetical protein
MKKKAFLTGILGIALIFATLLLVGCKTEDDDDGGAAVTNPFNGTAWKATDGAILTFTGDTATLTFSGSSTSGDYTYSGNTATLHLGPTAVTATISGNILTMSGKTYTKQ